MKNVLIKSLEELIPTTQDECENSHFKLFGFGIIDFMKNTSKPMKELVDRKLFSAILDRNDEVGKVMEEAMKVDPVLVILDFGNAKEPMIDELERVLTAEGFTNLRSYGGRLTFAKL